MRNVVNKFVKDQPFVAAALLVALGVYARVLFFGHISWDDPEMVFRNEAVQAFDLGTLFTSHYVGNYLPLTMLLHAVDWIFYGPNNWGHHLTNILLHVFNGWLVYKVSQRLFTDYTALPAAIIFLLHPIQVESVVWIGELKNVLSTTFYLAAVFYYIDFAKAGHKRAYVFAFLSFTAGCLSKASVVVLPLSLLCIDLLVTGRVTVKSLLNKVPFVVLSLLFGIINLKTQAADLFINHAHEFLYYQRIGYAGFALLKYLLLFVLPFNLSVIYPYPDNQSAVVIGYVVIAAIIALLTWQLKQRHYQAGAIVLFVLANLVLVLQFIPFGEVLYADRYLYVPLIGFAWLVGLALPRLKMDRRPILIIMMVFYGTVTFLRINPWKSAVSLYEDILKHYPDQFVALNSAGVERMFMNDDARALEYFDRAATAAPRNYKSYYNRGLLYMKMGKPQSAIGSFNQTLALYDYAKAYTGRASAYYMLGDLPKAMNDAKHAIETDDNARAHFVMGNCYNDLDQLDKALAEYNLAIGLSSEPDFYFKRAIAYGKQQDYKACLADLDACLQLNHEYYEAHFWRGVALVNLGREPCNDFRTAAQHDYEPAIRAYQKYCR